MDIEVLSRLQGTKLHQWRSLLTENGLQPDADPEQIVLVWDEDTLAATGARDGYLLKYIAVRQNYHGDDLTATVLTALRREAFLAGYRHLLLYTKPQNESIFSSLLFYPIVHTNDVLLMEDRKDGIREFLSNAQTANAAKTVGAIVMNGDPFTLGHRYLVETAADECEQVYIFVLSEDKSCFSADDRIEMARRGTADIPNVSVLPTGPYLISSATFPTYFLKNRDDATDIHCALDIAMFLKYFVPHFGITHRYIGEEPFSPMTAQYNAALKRALPECGITVREIPRRVKNGQPISASAVRRYLRDADRASARMLLPDTTFNFINGR